MPWYTNLKIVPFHMWHFTNTCDSPTQMTYKTEGFIALANKAVALTPKINHYDINTSQSHLICKFRRKNCKMHRRLTPSVLIEQGSQHYNLMWSYIAPLGLLQLSVEWKELSPFSAKQLIPVIYQQQGKHYCTEQVEQSVADLWS